MPMIVSGHASSTKIKTGRAYFGADTRRNVNDAP
jgi:hypothetical protein